RSRRFLFVLSACCGLWVGTLALPAPPTLAQHGQQGRHGPAIAFRVLACTNAAVWVNGLPADPNAVYDPEDEVEIDAGPGACVSIGRQVGRGPVQTENVTTSTTRVTSFQAIWIGDD